VPGAGRPFGREVSGVGRLRLEGCRETAHPHRAPRRGEDHETFDLVAQFSDVSLPTVGQQSVPDLRGELHRSPFVLEGEATEKELDQKGKILRALSQRWNLQRERPESLPQPEGAIPSSSLHLQIPLREAQQATPLAGRDVRQGGDGLDQSRLVFGWEVGDLVQHERASRGRQQALELGSETPELEVRSIQFHERPQPPSGAPVKHPGHQVLSRSRLPLEQHRRSFEDALHALQKRPHGRRFGDEIIGAPRVSSARSEGAE